jgi:hypothetical protein
MNIVLEAKVREITGHGKIVGKKAGRRGRRETIDKGRETKDERRKTKDERFSVGMAHHTAWFPA